MKPHLPRQFQPPKRPNTKEPSQLLRHGVMAWFFVAGLLSAGACIAEPAEVGRLFYSPAQRAQLEAARTHNITQRTVSSSRKQADAGSPPPAQRYDGVLIRSDGKTTRWVDGKPEVGPSSVPGLKPGQIRANGKVYEPYQILRSTPSGQNEPLIQESAP